MSEAAKTPLVDLLRAIPEDARLRWDDGPYSSHYAPIGLHAREAAAEITRLRGLVDEAKNVVEPFAQSAIDTAGEHDPDDWSVDVAQGLSFADLRAARAFLDKMKEG